MKGVGDILSFEREKLRLTIDEISQKTKIKKRFLIAIEKGDYLNLPDSVYTRGFILAYAQALGIEPQKILPFFRREYLEQLPKRSTTIPQPLKQSGFSLTPSKIIMTVASVILTVFLLFLFIQYREFAGVPALLVDFPPAEYQTPTTLLEIVGHTDSDAKVTINGEKVDVAVDGSFRLPYQLGLGNNEIVVIAESRLGKVSQQTLQVQLKNPVL